MDSKITTNENKYICSECKNENELGESSTVGDILECKFCGIEYEIIENDENGNFVLTIIEEEK